MPFVLFHKKVLKPVDICPICDYTNKVAAGYRGRLWGLSSAGRASALQAEGHRFEPCRPHITEYGGVAQLARACGSYPQCRGFKSPSRYEENGSCRTSVFLCDTACRRPPEAARTGLAHRRRMCLHGSGRDARGLWTAAKAGGHLQANVHRSGFAARCAQRAGWPDVPARIRARYSQMKYRFR